MASGPVTSWQIGEKVKSVTDVLFLGSKITVDGWLQPWNQKMIASWQESYDRPRQRVEKQRYHSAGKGPYSQGYSLSSGHVWLWELDCEEGRAPKNWCLLTVVLEKTPESPLDRKEIKLANLKGNQPWILIGRTETEAPVFWSLDTNSWLWESPWCWERLRAEREDGIRE